MMADGTFEAIGRADAAHLQDIGFGPFKAGDGVTLIEPKEGECSLTMGEEYCDNRSFRVGRLIGAQDPVLWDDRVDGWRDCGAAQAGAYRFAVVRWSDGKKGLIGAQYLWGAYDDPARLAAPPLKFLSYDDMVNLPDPQWLIEGVLMEKNSGLMFGKSNSFKSFLAVDIAGAVGTGNSWHGHKVSGAAPVLYVATEGGLGVAKQRIPGWMEAHGVPADQRQGAVTLYPQEISLDDTTAVNELLATCAYHAALRKLAAGQRVWNEKDPTGAYALIVIDIFGASMMGPETSDETARAWVRNVNRIMREVGCTVLTVAHTGWADDTRARMHTHFWGSFDTRMKAVGDKDSLTTVLSIDRHKDADSAGEWGFRLDKVTLTAGQTTLVPRLCDDVDTKHKPRLTGKQRVAMQALSEALIEKGRTITGPNYPSCNVVAVDEWRAMCDLHGLTDSTDLQTMGRTFRRIRNELHDKGEVRMFDGNVWKANQ